MWMIKLFKRYWKRSPRGDKIISQMYCTPLQLFPISPEVLPHPSWGWPGPRLWVPGVSKSDPHRAEHRAENRAVHRHTLHFTDVTGWGKSQGALSAAHHSRQAHYVNAAPNHQADGPQEISGKVSVVQSPGHRQYTSLRQQASLCASGNYFTLWSLLSAILLLVSGWTTSQKSH